MLDPIPFALVALAGFAAGVASGLFGVGGGILMVPAALYLVPGTDFHLAKAASLVVIVFSSGIGVWTHYRRQSVDVRQGVLLTLGGLGGAAAAVLLVEQVADLVLRGLFGLVIAAVGLRLALGRTPEPRAMPPGRARAFTLALGLGSGLLSGAFGIGGGVVVVPGLVFAGVGVHMAVGTSLVAVLTNAASATATHLTLGYGAALVALGVPLTVGAIPGTRLGSLLAHRLHADRLRAIFGGFLAVVGAGMAADALV